VLVAAVGFVVVAASAYAQRAEGAPRRGPAEGRQEKGGPEYVDAHNHLFGRGRSFGRDVVDFEGAAKEALALMDELGIRKMYVMPPPFPDDHPQVFDFSDLTGVIRKHPDRFAFLGGGGTLNPMLMRAVKEGRTSPDMKDRFERQALEILAQGAIGFGEMATEHFALGPQHPYESAPSDHPLLLLLADIAAREGVPIDLHMEAVDKAMSFPEKIRFRQNPGSLEPNIPAFERLLAHNPKASIIWAHVGWCHTGQRTTALCDRLLASHPNLYMSFKISRDSLPELSPLAPGQGLKTEWRDLILKYPDRFIIGTDQFYVSPRLDVQFPQRARGPRALINFLPPDAARQVGVENVRRLFGRD